MIAGRTQMVEKAFRIILLFNRKREVCIADVADELECAYSQAHRWVQDASRVLPIYESRKEGCKFYYQLVRESKNANNSHYSF